MQEELDWSDVDVFLRFLDTGRVPDTAMKLRVDETTVVRRLRRLQRALGVVLVETRDRRLVATEVALALRPEVEMMREASLQLLRASAQQQAGPSGVVRITAMSALFQTVIIPGLPAFRRRYPEIELSLLSEARNLSLSRREADIAVRFSVPTGADLVTRKLGDLGFTVYVARGSRPDALPWLGYTEDILHYPEPQWLERHRGSMPIIMRLNRIDILTTSAVKGVGKAILPCIVGDAEPGLVRAIEDPVLSREIWLAVHADDRSVARIRAFLDFMVDRFEAARAALLGAPS